MSEFTDYLTGIADAIRNKKGTAEPIPAAAFASEISALPTGGEDMEGITFSIFGYYDTILIMPEIMVTEIVL